MKVGEWMRQERLKRGYSQTQAAARMGVTKTSVCNWELGLNYPTASCLARVVQVYGVPDHGLDGWRDDWQKHKNIKNKKKKLQSVQAKKPHEMNNNDLIRQKCSKLLRCASCDCIDCCLFGKEIIKRGIDL